jgi:hypothetical protein
MKVDTQPDFVEAAMYMAPIGPFAGMYLAGCAQDVSCGYLGRLHMLTSNIERSITNHLLANFSDLGSSL